MTIETRRISFLDPQDIIRLLQEELDQTNREVMVLALELEARVEERTTKLALTQEELQRTNSELLQLTLELEDRVDRRTAELAQANESLREEIARRRTAESDLRAAHERLELAALSSKTGLWEWDLRADTLHCSPTCLRHFGCEQHDAIERLDDLGRFIHPEDWPQVAAAMRSFGENSAANLACEFRILRADGVERWALIQGSALPDEDSRSPRVLGALVDITDRKRAEHDLLASETRYRRLFESAKDGILILDASTGQIVDVNPFLIYLLGFTHEYFLGRKLWDIGTFRDIAASEAAFLELQEKGYVRYEDLPLEARDGQRIDVEFVSNVYLADSTKVVQCNIRDITERKRMEKEVLNLNADLERRVQLRTGQLEAANKELESFSYSVSHDLRAPLRSIDGFSRALLDDYTAVLDDVGKDYLVRVRAASQRMATMIDDLLSLSRVSRREVTLIPVNLSDIAQGVANDLQESDPQRTVAWAIEPGLLDTTDLHLIRHVLENLLGNAWKYSRNNPQARIEFGAIRDTGQPVYFVRDNGAGFDMRYVDKLFGAFQRLHGPDEFEGVGVGLATVKRVVQRFGGRVWAEGEVNQGATFYFTLHEAETDEQQDYSAR